MKNFRITFLFIIFFLSFISVSHSRSIPRLSGPIVDEAGIFKQTKSSLSQTLIDFHKSTGNQFQVLTIRSLEGDNLEDFSIRVVDTWKIGNQKTDRGLLLLFVQKEKRVRIEVGQGLEGEIPDALTGRIIQNRMIPQFKAQNFEGGMILGLKSLAEALGHDLLINADPSLFKKSTKKQKRTPPLFISLFYIAFIIVFLFISFSRPRRRYGSYRGRSGWGGGFGGGGFGGGGWSGGGGGFSGGGASGGW